MKKYTEIFKLKGLLDEHKIPYVYEVLDNDLQRLLGISRRHHIEVPVHGEKRLISIIQGQSTYGGEENLLEIMGLLTKEELKKDSVVGYLTAEDVLERILKHYEGEEMK